MKSIRDRRVDAYIENAAEFARPILRHLRALVHQACPEVTEDIKWNFPVFLHHGILCGIAGFKHHCTFGFWRGGMTAALKKDGFGGTDAMGHLGRITSRKDLPADRIMLKYIRQAAKLNEAGGPVRPLSKPKPAARVPADLAAALRKNKKAAANFKNFSPAKRRDYIEWITEAKRPATRAQRLGTTLQWVAEGKSRNWKYE